MRFFSSVALALALAVAGTARSEDKKLTLAQVGRLGKAATALVECDVRQGKSHGSAFCVHPSGLFVTNEHVVAGASAVRLVLNPSLKTQKVVKATVVRFDRDNDLALLRAEGVKDLPTLALGDSDKVEELMEVVACGFPFGRALTVSRDDYPAVSVNKGSVTSLRRKDGQLHRIQVDVALNPGNSGGALLDLEGKAVGVVVSGVRGAAVNFVIPVGLLARFLEKPELSFAAPKVTRADRGKPATFEARAVALVPGGKEAELELELMLTAGGKTRRVAMKRDGEVHRATAVPVPPAEGPVALRATLSYRDGSVTGSVRDRAVKIDGKERKLSEIRAFRGAPRPGVEFHDGKSHDGLPAGLEELEVDLGGETVKLKLSALVSASLAPAEEAAAVSCTVVARRGGKVVAEASDTISFPAAALVGAAPVASPGVAAAKLEGDKVTRSLPAAASDAVLGGGGRFLVLHLPKLRKAAIFDVSQTKVIGYVPLGEDGAKIAAGQTKVVVVLPDAGIIQRWDLATQKRELAVTLGVKGKVHQVALGSASEGPVVITSGEQFSGGANCLDLATLKPLALKKPQRGEGLPADATSPIRASSDGKVFGGWRCHLSPQGLFCVSLEGGELKFHYAHETVGHVIPGDDGRVLYTALGMYTTQVKPIGHSGRDGLHCLPAVRGPYYLGLKLHDGGKDKHRAQLFLAGETRPLITLKDVDWPEDMNQWGREKFGSDRRIWFVPEAKVLITIPAGLDKLVLHKFDVDAALEKSETDYLFVVSRPPAVARKGATLTYDVKVKSKKGGVKYELSSGPKGMEVTKAGQVRWAVPQDLDEKTVEVIVAVGDSSGQEVFHSFTLKLE